MSNTGLDVFDTTIEKTNQLLREIEIALSWEGKREKSYRVLRVVLQTLRDRLTIEETAQFAAQLPILVRGVFYAEWDPTHVPIKMNKNDFLLRIEQQANLTDADDIEKIVRVIFNAIKSNENTGEIEDVKDILPPDIASLL